MSCLSIAIYTTPYSIVCQEKEKSPAKTAESKKPQKKAKAEKGAEKQ